VVSRFALLVVCLISLAACARWPANATADGAVREFVERMGRVHGDGTDAKAAFDLLSKRAQENLAARAQRYGAASGKSIAPEAMIAPSRFLLRFEPQRFSAQVAGNYALVEVAGAQPEQVAKVPCVFEEGGWRVDVVLPPLPPVQVRPGSETP
jgi:hypothetical protein